MDATSKSSPQADSAPAPRWQRIEAPLFLVGATRSGTTLLSLMLNHHPQIDFPGEFEVSVDFIKPNGDFPEISDYHDWLHLHRHFHYHNLKIDPTLDYRDLVHSFLWQKHANSAGAAKSKVGVTVHRRCDQLLRLWPEARFVHIVRDPRDVGVSWMQRGWAGNLWAASLQWKKIETLWDELKPRIDPSRVVDLRFEDLIEDAPRHLAEICQMIGVDYSDEMLKYHENSTYGPVDAGEREKWRKRLSPMELQWVDAGAGEMLTARGYPKSDQPPLAVSQFGARKLMWKSRLNRLLFRIRRFGFQLWLEEKLSGLFRVKQWQRTVAARQHAIVDQQLK